MQPSSRRRWPLPIALVLAAASAPSCADPSLQPGRRVQPIYWGEPSSGYDGVVLLTIEFGAAGANCTGTLVTPRVVVTAKHCTVDESENPVDPEQITVSTGPTGGRDRYDVSDIRRTAGRRVYGDDFAVLITEDEVDAVTYPYARERTISEGDPVMLVGYGQRDDGGAGRKYEGENEIDRVFGDYFVTVGESACYGDSGGPVFDEEGVLIGVIVNTLGGWDGGDSCASGYSGISRVDSYAEIVDLAIEDAWVCDGADAEICGDARDNDCDRLTDEECMPLGDACALAIDCASGDCRDVGQGLVCVQACTPGGGEDEPACPEGTYCDEKACGEGLCTPGDAGVLPLGAECADDTDCRSLTCAGGRCLRRCGSTDECAAGETCAGGGDGGCGGCAPEGPAAPFGAPCAEAAECASGMCIEDAFGSLCTTPCTDACPDGFACDAGGQCVRPAPDGWPTGTACIEAGDCASELCGSFPEGRACTDFCDPTHPCPAGMQCEPQEEGSLCTPDLAVEGQACDANADCITEMCGNFGDFEACTAACGESAPCPPGFACQMDGADADGGYCRPLEAPDMEREDGGCGCRQVGVEGPDVGPAWFLLVAAAASVAVRTRRARRTPKEET